jgi:hypothetical protein
LIRSQEDGQVRERERGMHVRASQSSPELTASCTGTAARLRERLIRSQEDGQVSDGKTLLPLHQHQPLQSPPPAPPPPRPPPGLAPPLFPPPAVRERTEGGRGAQGSAEDKRSQTGTAARESEKPSRLKSSSHRSHARSRACSPICTYRHADTRMSVRAHKTHTRSLTHAHKTQLALLDS